MLTARKYLDMSSDAADGTKTRELHNAICYFGNRRPEGETSTA